MGSQRFEATCSHCAEKTRVSESMVNLYQKCPSCSKTFHVTNVRAIRASEIPKAEREQTPEVRLAIRAGSVLAVLLLLIAMRGPLGRFAGSIIYGFDTAEVRSWYAEIEPGMTQEQVYQHLTKMPRFGEFNSVALGAAGSMQFEGTSIKGSMSGSGTRDAEAAGESIRTRVRIETMNDDTFGVKYPGTRTRLTATTDGNLMQVKQETYYGSFKAFIASEWRLDFRLNDQEEMGRCKLRFYFKGQSGGGAARLERVETSGF